MRGKRRVLRRGGAGGSFVGRGRLLLGRTSTHPPRRSLRRRGRSASQTVSQAEKCDEIAERVALAAASALEDLDGRRRHRGRSGRRDVTRGAGSGVGVLGRPRRRA